MGSRVGELLLSCSPSVSGTLGTLQRQLGSAPCGHMRQIGERRFANRAPSRESMRDDRVWGGDQKLAILTRSFYPTRSFFSAWQVFLPAIGVGATRRPRRVTLPDMNQPQLHAWLHFAFGRC